MPENACFSVVFGLFLIGYINVLYMPKFGINYLLLQLIKNAILMIRLTKLAFTKTKCYKWSYKFTI